MTARLTHGASRKVLMGSAPHKKAVATSFKVVSPGMTATWQRFQRCRHNYIEAGEAKT